MKKNINVNIAGVIFHMDEDAYEKLEAYLSLLRRHFAHSEGKEEILADIETRIAEMLQEKLGEAKQVIVLPDIDSVINALGQPSDWDSGSEQSANQAQHQRSNRLYRDPDGKVIGGVCSGLAYYFNIDPLWVRLGFLVVTLAGFGAGIIAYLLLWAFAPEARTTAEKLEMRGKRVTISNIERSINEEFSGLKGKLNEMKDEAKEAWSRNKGRSSNLFEKIFNVFLQFITIIAKAIAIFLGLLFISLGLFMIIGFLFSFIDTGQEFYVTSFGLSTISLPALLRLVLEPGELGLGILGLSLVVGIPLVLMIYFGARLIFHFKSPARFVGIPAFSLLLAGLIICSIVALQTVKNFSRKVTTQKSHALTQPKGNILVIDMSNQGYTAESYAFDDDFMIGDWNYFHRGDSTVFFGIPRLEVIRSENDSFTLQTRLHARGRNIEQARERSGNITYSFTQQDSLLLLDPYYYIPTGDKIRGQEVRLVLAVPEGKQVHFKAGTGIFYEHHNDYDSPRLSGKKWIMKEQWLQELSPGRVNKPDTARYL